MGLESLEARIVVHEKNEAVYEEDIAFLKYDVQVKDISIKDLKNQLEEALKEKDDLKLKLEKFEESSKNLTKLINSQISAKDKAGLGYDSQMNESEVVYSVFNIRESDLDDSPVNDRFKTGEGFHAVPLPYIENYMPSRPDLSFARLDDYVYKTKVSETETCISKTSKDIEEKPKIVRPSAPIIEDWDIDSDNDSVFRPKSDHTKPKLTKIIFFKSDENVKSVNKENTHRQVEYPRKSQNPRNNRRNWNGMMTQKLGNVATKSRQVPVNAAKQSSLRAAASISTARPINTIAPKLKRPTGNVFDNTSKDSGSYMLKKFDYVDLQDYQEINGGLVAFGGSPKGGKITGKGSGPDWLFDIDLLTNSMNYKPVTAGNQTNRNAGIKEYILLPLLYDSPQSSEDAVADDAGKKTNEEPANEAALDNLFVQQKEGYASITNRDSIVSPSVSIAGQSFTNADDLPTDPLMPDLEDTTDLLNTSIFSGAYDDEDVGAEADLNNLEITMNVSPIPITKIHKDRPKEQIIGDLLSAPQTRRMTKSVQEHAMVSYIKRQIRINHKDYQNYLFTYFLLQIEPKKVTQALTDPSWIEAMQDELLQFSLQKKDERGIVVRNKARLVAQGYTQEEGIDYDKVFALVARIEAIRFRRGTIDKTLFIKKDKGDILLVQVYIDDIIFGSTKKSLCVDFKQMMYKRFQMSSMRELTFLLGLQTASAPIETNKALLKDEEAIGSLMNLTASRPNIMFVVCSCARFQVTSKVSHLHVVKMIFRYLRCQPKLGLWYPKDSPFNLEAFSDSDYVGASLNRKSTTGVSEYVAAANYCGQIATVRTINNGEQEITVTVDGKEFTITEAFVRRHLQLADVEGISTLPTTRIFDQLSLMGYVLTDDKLTFQKGKFSPQWRFLIHTILHCPSPKKTSLEQYSSNIATAITYLATNRTFNFSKLIFDGMDDRVERATTNDASLDVAQASGNITKTQFMAIPNVPFPQGIGVGGSLRCQEATGGSLAQTRSERVPTQPHDSLLLRVNTLGSDEGSLQLQELKALCIKLSDRVLALETDLR
ncbi:putative ribonuclease H-like domain-containing protein [Tanacetum coccineum]